VTVPVNAAGEWIAQLPPVLARRVATTITFIHHPPSSEDNGPPGLPKTALGSTAINLTDVLFGDVFLCGGQSNMELSLSYVQVC
jgi:hypothetical protein